MSFLDLGVMSRRGQATVILVPLEMKEIEKLFRQQNYSLYSFKESLRAKALSWSSSCSSDTPAAGHSLQEQKAFLQGASTGASGGGFCWARGGGGREQETPGVQEHGEQPSRSPLD
eukprot:58087-Pelagomonas_calceolata.AAC.1